MNRKCWFFAAASVLAAALVLASCGPSGRGAQGNAGTAEGKTGDKSGGANTPGDFGYVRGKGGVVIAYYTGTGTDVVIPDTIDGLPVVDMYTSAFKENPAITSVTVPGTVKLIPGGAFSKCSGLVSVSLSGGTTEIGSGAFSGCTSLAAIVIPEGVTAIGGSAFEGCTSLAAVQLPESLTTLGASAFSGCVNLANLNVPAALTGFPNLSSAYRYSYAFSGCYKIPLNVRDALKSQGYKADLDDYGNYTW